MADVPVTVRALAVVRPAAVELTLRPIPLVVIVVFTAFPVEMEVAESPLPVVALDVMAAVATVPVKVGDAESTKLPVPVTVLASVTPP